MIDLTSQTLHDIVPPMNSFQQDVRDFNQAMGFGHPTDPSIERYPFQLRCDLILEEAHEFVEACKDPNWVEMIDALIDLLYVTFGALDAMGVDATLFWDEVHRSNMLKLGPDGQPIRRADGKITKPEGWQPPDIAKVLRMLTSR